MSLDAIYPVLMCGDHQSAFWPVSRTNSPLRFARINNTHSQLQICLQSLADNGLGPATMVVSSKERYLAQDQTDQIGADMGTMIVTPKDRGTAPSVCAAAEVISRTRPDALLLVVLGNRCQFNTDTIKEALRLGTSGAENGKFVCFGTPPGDGAQGDRLIELGQGTCHSIAPQPVSQIILAGDTAKELLETKRYLWAADFILVSAKTLRGIYGRQAAAIRSSVRRAVREGVEDQQAFILSDTFSELETSDFETTIMDRQQGIAVPIVQSAQTPSSWAELWQQTPKSNRGVATYGAAQAIDCHNSLLSSPSGELQVLGLGLRDVAVVAVEDAVLVMDLNRASSLPDAVAKMERLSIPQSKSSRITYHPWDR